MIPPDGAPAKALTDRDRTTLAAIYGLARLRLQCPPALAEAILMLTSAVRRSTWGAR